MIKEPDPIPATPVSDEHASRLVQLLTAVKLLTDWPKLKPLQDEISILLDEMAAEAVVRNEERNVKVKARDEEIARLKAEEAEKVRLAAERQAERPVSRPPPPPLEPRPERHEYNPPPPRRV